MTYNEYLLSGLSDITCCFGGCNYYWSMSAYDLLVFTLGSFVLISILLFYYNRIPKSNISKDKLDNPIYQSTNVLLQSKSNETNFVIAKKSTSTFVKVLAYLLILYIIITPFNQYLNFDFSY